MADTLSLDIEVRCSNCRSVLDVNGNITQDHYGDYVIEIAPCEDCLEEARKEATEDE